jgi:hypothetical protein
MEVWCCSEARRERRDEGAPPSQLVQLEREGAREGGAKDLVEVEGLR